MTFNEGIMMGFLLIELIKLYSEYLNEFCEFSPLAEEFHNVNFLDKHINLNLNTLFLAVTVC